MKFKGIKVAVMVAAAMVAAACGGNGGDTDTPSATVEKYFNMLVKGDYLKAVDMLCDADKASTEDKEALAKWCEEELSKKGGLKSCEVVSEEIAEDGTKAKVTIRYAYGNGEEKEETTTVMKCDDGWCATLF